MRKQSGFAVLEILLVVVVLSVIAFTAYNFMTRDTGTVTSATASVPLAPEVNQASDLTTASKALDSVNVDEGTADSAALDSELSAF